MFSCKLYYDSTHTTMDNTIVCCVLYYTAHNEVRGGILESPCPSIRPSVCPSIRPSVVRIWVSGA